MPSVISKISPAAWSALAIGGSFGLAILGRALGGAFWLPVAAVAGIWAVICSAIAWVRTDETAREAHKSAWLWGGGVGVLVALAASFSDPIARQAIDLHRDFMDGPSGDVPTQAFTAGVMFAFGLQIAAYFIAWGGWWMGKR